MSAHSTATVPLHGRSGKASASLPAERLSLAALFAQAAARHPQRIALTFAEQHMTYAELEQATDAVAAGLAERGIGPGALVAIFLDRSLDMLIAMLGVIKAGAAYLPLDTRYPHERIVETLADASPAALIGSRSATLSGLPAATLYVTIEDLQLQAAAPPASQPCAPGSAAYVIYTSGSTGKPKGVIVTHANVVSLMQSTEPRFRFNEHDVWTMFHSFAFDFSVWEIWGCLLHGGRLVVVPYTVSRSPEDFHALLVAEQVTVLNQTPSAFALLQAADAQAAGRLDALRLVIFGGEALVPAQLAAWFTRYSDSHPRMINMYGITETTVHVTWRQMLTSDAVTERESLIGEPIPSLELRLLDEELRPVAHGAEGEIVIGGAGVSAGYLNRPELTRERFVADPAGPVGATLYRSGDLARRRADGELVYLGRRDGQVKINGFRIEPGEVEAALLSVGGVQQVCVLAITDEASGAGAASRLAAYLIADRDLPHGDLSRALARTLPAHMLPSFYIQLPAMPINANGKIDRKALPAPLRIEPAPETVAGSSLPGIVAATWRSILHSDQFGNEDNFFDCGGTSVLLIAVRAALQERLGRAIPIAWMFECTTVDSLAKRLGSDATAQPATASVELNARKQRDAFARARATRQSARSTNPGNIRSIA